MLDRMNTLFKSLDGFTFTNLNRLLSDNGALIVIGISDNEP